MPYKPDTEINLAPRTDKIYLASSAHRRKQKDKSRWTISIDDEIECFILSQISNWVETAKAWGLRLNRNSLEQVGENPQREALKLAKFVDSSGNNVWHGYPADYVRNNQDRPGMVVLLAWRALGIIEKHQ